MRLFKKANKRRMRKPGWKLDKKIIQKRADSAYTAQKTAQFYQSGTFPPDKFFILPMQKHARSPTFPTFFTDFTYFTNKLPYIE